MPFCIVNFQNAPYTEVIASVARTKIGSISVCSAPFERSPTIFVVLPPMSIPITVLILFSSEIRENYSDANIITYY